MVVEKGGGRLVAVVRGTATNLDISGLHTSEELKIKHKNKVKPI